MANFADVVMWGQGLEQQAQKNADQHQIVLSNLASAKLNQENANLDLAQKKAELANEAAFKNVVLQQLAGEEKQQSDLATLSGQPTEYQSMQGNLQDVTDRMKSHASLVSATQKAINAYAKTDPIYAQKMQGELNKQIGDAFKLTKEHNEILEKAASKISDELFPVMNKDGIPGKFDPELYRKWYAAREAEGTPLAEQGLTGDPTQDEQQVRLTYAKGVATKDQAAQQSRYLAEQERSYMDKIRADKYASDMQHQRATEAISREKVANTSALKGPIVVERKEQDAAYGKYRAAYDRLVAQRRGNVNKKTGQRVPPDAVTLRAIDRQIDSLTENFEAQKKAIRGSYGLVDKGAAAPSTADDFWNK